MPALADPNFSHRYSSWVGGFNEETAPARVRRSMTAPPRSATAAGAVLLGQT